MDTNEFLNRADACLAKVAKWLEDLDPDEVDYSGGDGALTIEFADGTRFVLSRQSSASQLWLAAGAHGWHFDWDPASEKWVDDKDGQSLCARLAASISDKLGHRVVSDS